MTPTHTCVRQHTRGGGELKDKTSNERLTRSASERSPILTGAPGTCEEGGGERKPLVTTGDGQSGLLQPNTKAHTPHWWTNHNHSTVVQGGDYLVQGATRRHDHLVQDHYQPHLTIHTNLASRCQLKQKKGRRPFFFSFAEAIQQTTTTTEPKDH